MIYRDVDPITWAKKYGLDIIEAKCPDCGSFVKLNVPFETADSWGLTNAEHNGCTQQVFQGAFKEFSLSEPSTQKGPSNGK